MLTLMWTLFKGGAGSQGWNIEGGSLLSWGCPLSHGMSAVLWCLLSHEAAIVSHPAVPCWPLCPDQRAMSQLLCPWQLSYEAGQGWSGSCSCGWAPLPGGFIRPLTSTLTWDCAPSQQDDGPFLETSSLSPTNWDHFSLLAVWSLCIPE